MKIKTDKNTFEAPYTVIQRDSILGSRYPQWAILDKRSGAQVTKWVGGDGPNQAFPLSIVQTLKELNELALTQWKFQGGDEITVASTGRKDLGNDTTLTPSQLEAYEASHPNPKATS